MVGSEVVVLVVLLVVVGSGVVVVLVVGSEVGSEVVGSSGVNISIDTLLSIHPNREHVNNNIEVKITSL